MMKEEMIAALEFVTRERLHKSVVPLYRSVAGGLLVPIGTGTLFQIAEEHFLVTAAHVSDDLGDGDDKAALVTCALERSEPVQLTGKSLSTDSQTDVSVFLLDPTVVARLPGRVPLRLSDVCLAAPGPEAPIFIHGYPQEYQKRTDDEHQPAALTYPSKLFQGSPPDNYDPNLHILVGYSEENLASNLEDEASFPRLQGISGSSIWCGFTPPSGTTQTLKDIKVIAVQTSVFPRLKLIKGTRWEVVLVLIYDKCPDLRGAITVNSEAMGGSSR